MRALLYEPARTHLAQMVEPRQAGSIMVKYGPKLRINRSKLLNDLVSEHAGDERGAGDGHERAGAGTHTGTGPGPVQY